jgi:AbrB family looped-hinge helix DNA binding protein
VQKTKGLQAPYFDNDVQVCILKGLRRRFSQVQKLPIRRNGVVQPGRLRAAIAIWHLPWHKDIMSARVTVDKAGRIVLPKPVRDQLRLAPGNTLQLDTEGERIILRPVRQNASMRKEFGIWVFEEEKPSDDSIPELIDLEREKRNLKHYRVLAPRMAPRIRTP